MRASKRVLRAGSLAAVSAVALSGCVSPYDLPLPGGADVGDDPYSVTVKFRDVLDLVPQSAVRVDDIAVGKVDSVDLDGWTATVKISVNRDVRLPDDAQASIRQTSLLGEKFVSLAAPSNGGTGRLSNGDVIGLDRSGRNPEIEEVLGAASLLFNGGGLEKTNTIVRELNKTLDGNEPEVKELLDTATSFLGELDRNKSQILTALEKVDRLSRETIRQRRSIESALDELPEALRVVDDQRDELVGLLQSLNRLSDVATGVIRRSKADTLATLRDLEPTLKALANSGDALPKATEALFTFPFTDGVVGNSLSRAQNQICNDSSASNGEKAAKGSCFGEFYNLSIRLGLNLQQGSNLLQGIFSLFQAAIDRAGGGAATTSEPDADSSAGDSTSGAGDTSTDGLVDLVEGLAPQTSEEPKSSPGTAGPSASPGPSSSPSPSGSSGGQSGFCSTLGLCRTTASSVQDAQRSDVGRLFLTPVVSS